MDPPTGGEEEGALNSQISMEESWPSIDRAVQRFWAEEQDYGVCKIMSTDDKSDGMNHKMRKQSLHGGSDDKKQKKEYIRKVGL